LKPVAGMVLSFAAALAMASTTVPKGTQVTLTFDQAVSSRKAHSGDKIKMHVTNDVVVDGRTVIKAGTPLWATVDEVKKNERFGINAHLKLDLPNVSGIPLKPRIQGKDSGSSADHAAEVAGAGALVLGPIGLLGSYFVVGKPVKVKDGDTLQTQVAEDTVVR